MGKKFDQTRRCAVQLYNAIYFKHMSLKGLTNPQNGMAAFLRLNQTEQNLAKAILYYSLRYNNNINYIINSHLKNDLPKGATQLKAILICSAAQIIYMDLADYANINAAVELAKYDGRTKRFAPLVNAILRQIARDKEKGKISQKYKEGLQALPQFIQDKLINFYGQDQAQEIACALLSQKSIDLSLKDSSKENVELWAKKLNAKIMGEANIRLPLAFKTDIEKIEGYEQGHWWVQDANAAKIVNFLSNIKGQNVADLCAAPGGKTLQLILKGGKVTAFEQNENRAKRLSQNLARIGQTAQIIVGDFTKFKNQKFDKILLDAPCSSTGTARKNIDVLFNQSQEEITNLAQLQFELLNCAYEMLNDDGTLVFCNCSIFFDEGEEVIKKFNKIKTAKNIKMIRFSPFIDHNIEPSYAQASDGFFVAIIKK